MFKSLVASAFVGQALLVAAPVAAYTNCKTFTNFHICSSIISSTLHELTITSRDNSKKVEFNVTCTGDKWIVHEGGAVRNLTQQQANYIAQSAAKGYCDGLGSMFTSY